MTKHTWIMEGKRGISSEAIWGHFSVGTVGRKWFTNPYDPWDFLRCYWLLKLAPEWRERIAEMAEYHGWEKLAPAWDELESMLLEAWPECCASGEYHNETPAQKMYERMMELTKSGG